MRHATMIATALVAVLASTGAPRADTLRDRCDNRAREVSGYYGGRIPSFNIGPFTAQIGGSVAIGVGRSRGATSPASPPFAGSYSVEQREAAKAKKYERALADCMARG